MYYQPRTSLGDTLARFYRGALCKGRVVTSSFQGDPKMANVQEVAVMSGEEMISLARKHTLFEWSAQSKADPIPVARAKGIYFWTPEGKHFIDFNRDIWGDASPAISRRPL
jgi:hypothetical protein